MKMSAYADCKNSFTMKERTMGNTKEKEWLSVVLLTIAVLGALFFSIDGCFFMGFLARVSVCQRPMRWRWN